MYDDILSNILNESVLLDDIYKWLSSNIPPDTLSQITGLNGELSKLSVNTFVTYVTSQIRVETQWKLDETENKQSTSKSTPSSAITSPPTSSTCETSNTSEFCDSSISSSRGIIKLKSPKYAATPSPHNDNPFAFSTPKRDAVPSPFKTPDRTSFNESPTYPKPKGRNFSADNNWSKPKPKPHLNNSWNDDQRPKAKIKLSLGDFIKCEETPKRGNRRRIKPTKISPLPLEKQPVENAFFQTPEVSNDSKVSVDDRMLLKKECSSLQEALAKDSSAVPLLSPKKTSDISESPTLISPPTTPAKEIIVPVNLESVSHRRRLEILAELYAFIIRGNHCENLMMELYFVISLLNKPHNKEPRDGTLNLNSGSNCIFFAISVLLPLCDILKMLNSITITLLAANDFILEFSPLLHEKLQEISCQKLNKSSPPVDVFQDGNVSFQCDTDSVENFSKHVYFTMFRKQRDGFYQLLQEWETKNHVPSWTNKVKTILTTCEDPTNMIHLARLFRNQLLASCSACRPTDEAGKELLQLLPSADRGKLSRLEARLTGSRPRRGPVPPPDFPGCQEFFRNFIHTCGCGLFTHFLQLSLADELLKLNDMEFSDDIIDVDEITRKRFTEVVSQCCLLAKFLAVVEFLPYKGSEQYTANSIQLHRSIRLRTNSLFEIDKCFYNAWKNHRLTLTMPWLANYLSLMDQTTASLPTNQQLLGSLLTASRSLPSSINPTGRFMIQLCLGWLFQVASFQGVTPTSLVEPDAEAGLDEMELVSETCLYRVCPYLSELNSLLTGNVTAGPKRHIRPTQQFETSASGNSAEKILELRLEESFLQNQSSSTRRTIQFVTERVASSCIKHILAKVTPVIHKEMIEKAVLKAKDRPKKSNTEPDLQMISQDWNNRIRNESLAAAWKICSLQVEQALRALFGPDLSESAIKISCELTSRQAMEKVEGWMQCNLLGAEATSHRYEEMKNLHSKSETIQGDGGNLNEEMAHLSLADLSNSIIALRGIYLNALRGQLNEVHMQSVLHSLHQSLLNDSVITKARIGNILADLLIVICISCPYATSTSLLIAEYIKSLEPRQPSFLRVLCPRNLHLAQTFNNPLGLVMTFSVLLKAAIITTDEILSQVQEILQIKLSQELEHQKLIILQLMCEERIIEYKSLDSLNERNR